MVTKAYQIRVFCVDNFDQFQVIFSEVAWLDFNTASEMKEQFAESCIKKWSLQEIINVDILTLEIR